MFICGLSIDTFLHGDGVFAIFLLFMLLLMLLLLLVVLILFIIVVVREQFYKPIKVEGP